MDTVMQRTSYGPHERRKLAKAHNVFQHPSGSAGPDNRKTENRKTADPWVSRYSVDLKGARSRTIPRNLYAGL